MNCISSDFRHFGPANLEKCISLYGAYSYLKDHHSKSLLVEEFPSEMMKNTFFFRKDMVTCYFVGEEIALYFDYGYLSLHGFFAIDDRFRFRIDDIQHAVTGLYYYSISELFHEK